MLASDGSRLGPNMQFGLHAKRLKRSNECNWACTTATGRFSNDQTTATQNRGTDSQFRSVGPSIPC